MTASLTEVKRKEKEKSIKNFNLMFRIIVCLRRPGRPFHQLRRYTLVSSFVDLDLYAYYGHNPTLLAGMCRYVQISIRLNVSQDV